MVSHSSEPPFPRKLKWALGVSFACFLAVYFILQLKYRLGELDDTWWLTYAYNYLHKHITYDLFLGTNLLGAGVQCFGKTYAFVIGIVFDAFGWTKTNAFDLSLAFLLGGFTAWYFILRRFQYSRELCAVFCVSGLLLDPFFSAAVSTRTEAFIFFVSALALLLFVQGRYFESMAAAWLSLETHPIGAVAFFLITAAFWAMKRPAFSPQPKTFKMLLLSLAGFGAGALYYLYLHADHLAELPQGLLSNNQISTQSVQNFLYDYFFHSKYHRHLAEFVLLAYCSLEFLRKKIYVKDPFILPLAISLILFTLVFRRPNFHYTLFFYPVFLLMAARIFEIRRNLSWLVLGFLCLLLPQYAFAYYLNRNYDYNLELKTFQQMIPADSLPILGSPDAWFAFPNRDFYFNGYVGDFPKLGLSRFYLIREEGNKENITEKSDYIQTHYQAKPIGEFTMNKWHFIITLEEALSGDHH